MDDLMLNRLKLLSDQIKLQSNLSSQLTIHNNEDKYKAEVIEAKLQTLLRRFNDDLCNYFRLVNEPSADDVGKMSEIQLEAEDNLAELGVRIRMFTNNDAIHKETSQPTSCASGRLPKLNLPEFDGDVLNWHQFWDQFSSNIDARNISEVDKLLYLKASVKGEAKQVIDGFDTTNANYQIALNTLRERYGSQCHLVDAHYSALSRIKTNNATTQECRRTLTEVERHLRVLESLGEDVNHNHLRHLIFEKFPEDLIYELKIKSTDNSIGEMRRLLETIITAREDANRIVQDKNPKEMGNYTVETLHVVQGNNFHLPEQRAVSRNVNRYQRGGRNFPPRRTGQDSLKRRYSQSKTIEAKSSVDRTTEPKDKMRKLSCIFCKGPHFNDQCVKYRTIQERKTVLKNNCFKCLRHGHVVNRCNAKVKCFHCGSLRHNRSLCPKGMKGTSVKTSTLSAVFERGNAVLQTAVVIAVREGNSQQYAKCRILLDSGSQRSYVTKRIVNKLELPTEEEQNLSVFTFGAEAPKEFESPIVKLLLKTRDQSMFVGTIFANVVPTISKGIPCPPLELGSWKDKKLLADDGSCDQVDILIGNDYYYTFMESEKVQIKENLFLVNSKFGWILSGIVNPDAQDALTVVTYFQTDIEMSLNKPDLPINQGNVTSLWELESIGITDSPKATKEEEAIRSFNESTTFIDGRYYVHWPWKEYPPNLNTNFGMTVGRLKGLIKRTTSEGLKLYDETLKDQLQKGIIEQVSEFERTTCTNPVHYLPHHGVQQPGKATRIVYDASAKIKDCKSLNECLYCGPVMLEELTKLIIRFRSFPIGISADVEKAFLQIGLHKEDRDVTRFLWLKDITKPVTRENLLCLRFTRVPFGIISSPFLLNATIRHHLMKSEESVVRNAANDIYVDNLVTGTQTIEEAMILYKHCKETFQNISMNLRDWSSNAEKFLEKIPDACQHKVVKLLGLEWNLENDTLRIQFKRDKIHANTKREILSVIASVYDPCGFATPTVLIGKLILQELWKDKIKWDTPIPEAMAHKWSEVINDFNEIAQITIPRVFPSRKECDLHCFTDASMQAYAAVVYITSEGKKSFVIGKSRLVPIKEQEHLKIPRLELLGALIGSRLLKYVIDSLHLNIRRQILWTDSQIVIDWYNSEKLLPPFVARRIEEIKKNKQLLVKYVPTDLNPADVATKPTNAKDRYKWLIGPEFITNSPASWPTHNTQNTVNLLAPEGLGLSPPRKSKTLSGNNNKSKQISIVQESIPQNKVEILKALQAQYFPEEFDGNETNLSRNLRLFKDVDGILRCKGRFMNADWSFEKRYPILIPKESKFTNDIIMNIHKDNYHVGVNHTLSIIRQSYWIPQGKSKVQKILKQCPNCVKHNGGPFKLPPTPALPPERVNYSAPFTFVGVDYMGPLLIKEGNSECKRWIGLYTCLAIRAIHLEVVKDLTAEEGLLSLRRMIASRGIPTLITSDNAMHFKLMSEILSNQYCIDKEIRWRFIPQLAPWVGGFYERLIGIVKNCMKRTLRKHMLTDSQLSTVVKEIEATVNMRPLTSVDSELDHILKPADFLAFGKCLTTELSSEDPIIKGTITKTDLVKSWKKGLIILQEFKEMFINRYLPSLRERFRHSHKEPRVVSKLSPAVGQVVQLQGDSKNRETWKVGKVSSVEVGKDGMCRVAKVKVGNKEFTRSIAHLYPLEIEDEENRMNFIDNSEEHRIKTPVALEPVEINTDTNNENTCQDVRLENIEELLLDTDGRTDESENNEIKEVENESIITKEGTRERRRAATKALQKIREWTHNLISLL